MRDLHQTKLIGTYLRQHHRFKQMDDETRANEEASDTPMSLRKTINELERENFDLTAKVIYLINKCGWSEGRKFTFPDGDTWTEFKPEFPNNPEDSKHD